jgi:hypothetical protein
MFFVMRYVISGNTRFLGVIQGDRRLLLAGGLNGMVAGGVLGRWRVPTPGKTL